VVFFVMSATQALNRTVEEFRAVTAMVCGVVDDIGGSNEAEVEADLAQRVLHQVVAATSAPSTVIVCTAAIVAALAAAFRMEWVGGPHADDADAGAELAQDALCETSAPLIAQPAKRGCDVDNDREDYSAGDNDR
jgi:hypothetical protein